MKCLVIGLVALTIAGAADAKVVTVTWTGVVVDDNRQIDVNGRFGTAGSDLSNAAFTNTYTFDTLRGHAVQTSTESYVEGGSQYGYPTPVV